MTTIETPTGAAETMVLNMGPQHPSTHGVLRVVLELNGEIVVSASRISVICTRGLKKLRIEDLFAGDYFDGPARLSGAAFEQSLLLPGGGENSEYRSAEAGAIHSRVADGIDANCFASGVGGDARDRSGRDDCVPLRLPRARRDHENFGDGFRAAHDDELFPDWRIGAGAAAWLAGARGAVSGFFSGHVAEYEDLLTQNRIWWGARRGLDF